MDKRKQIFFIGGYSGGGVVLNEINKRKEVILQSFKEIYPKDSNIMLNAIASLFPLFSNSVLYPSDLTSNSELHQAMRIAAKDKFDSYFSLSLDNIKISRKEVDNSLLNMEELELRAYIRSLNERELFSDYLEEIKHNLSRIPEDRIELILSVIVFQSGRIEAEDAKLIGFGTADISVYTISDLLLRISNENIRYGLVASMLSNTDFESFQFLLHLLHIIELTHGRVAETSYIQEEKLITLEHLYELEGIFLERIKSFITETNLLDWKEARRASFLWEFIQKESYIDYMSESLSDAFSVPKYISIKANEWSSSDGTCGYTFDDKSYTNYIDDATIIDAINKVRLSEAFWSLDKRAIETSAAFILKSTNIIGNHEGNISLINEIIDRWKKEFTEQATQ